MAFADRFAKSETTVPDGRVECYFSDAGKQAAAMGRKPIELRSTIQSHFKATSH